MCLHVSCVYVPAYVRASYECVCLYVCVCVSATTLCVYLSVYLNFHIVHENCLQCLTACPVKDLKAGQDRRHLSTPHLLGKRERECVCVRVCVCMCERENV